MTNQTLLENIASTEHALESAKAALRISATGDDTPVEYALVSLDYSLALADHDSAMSDMFNYWTVTV